MKNVIMNNMQKIFIFVIIALPFLTACVNGLPQNWRLPTDKELKATWRDENKGKYAIVKGDFNSDKIVDEAKLLVRKDGMGFGLFAFVSQKDNYFKTYLLDEMQDHTLIQVFGIKDVASGVYKTACGKGYWDCQQGETPEIVIKNTAIDYFKTEGANSFFYWDNKENTFKRIWISD
ncbi:hypothetical protein [Desulfovibrio litoralis]|uniref:Lipoprotein n=1 Tax=Desulfovibrio litoralis DSM 11393 TaxID=1121455 RepID=A0A1M7SGA6_9BACT|nr:hypothetical protein [Desulfovibrio litoralis]SHN57494.1 hypothetical protein SAMN02745728_00912 [Desulfovibrio litoralis DSM 11393]